MRELSGRVAVVTGAASGIGRALAVRFAAEGMSLMLADVDPRGLSQTAAMISGVKVLTQITDVSDAPAVQHLAHRAFGELGAVHVLCNNAGVFQGGRIWTRTEEDVAWLLGVNLWGVLHGIREFVPRMIEQGTEGHIVNTVSVAGLFAGANTGGHAVTKYAALAASQSLALDLAQIGSKLRVTALCPGGVRTGISRSERVRAGRPGRGPHPRRPHLPGVARRDAGEGHGAGRGGRRHRRGHQAGALPRPHPPRLRRQPARADDGPAGGPASRAARRRASPLAVRIHWEHRIHLLGGFLGV
ncbi:SDR family NAD(P)-dependent oxidoreductase [Nonomuraea dietziae]|uniref:SDR family NAD(P)-dependent oxidoreductase n=1 Tax=Nonomuraea dietziae TaxID=65515 RepID=UPI0031D5257A